MQPGLGPPSPAVATRGPSGGRRAAIIGSGFGGLAAAIRLLARGWQVEVFEALDEVGGRARAFRERGYTFDMGPTVLTAPFLFEELWQLAGRRLADHVTLVPVDPFYHVRFGDGSWFRYNGDAEHMRAEVARVAPGDVAGYERFVALSGKIFEVGFRQLAHADFGRWQAMARILPAMVRLKSYYSVAQLVARYVRDERLRQVLSFHPLLVGGNPFTTTSIYALILFLEREWGVHYALGGTHRLIRGMVDLIHTMGGHVHTRSPVTALAWRGRRVTGVQVGGDGLGRQLACDAVVSNACVTWTYLNLVPAPLRRRWTAARLGRRRFSMGLFVWYFGTRRQYPDVAHHTILLGPRYRALLDDIFRHQRLADDHSLYLHRPTATDPTMAPAGHDAFYVLSPVPNLGAGIDWAAAQEGYRRRIAATLAETVLPSLADHLTVSRVMTPQHFSDELASHQGAAFAMAPILRQSAYFRPHNRSEDVDGLYFVGAGTHPGAGVPGVLSSARVLDHHLGDGHASQPQVA